MQPHNNEIVWRGPPRPRNRSGVLRVSADDYVVEGGTIRRKTRPVHPAPRIARPLAAGTITKRD